MSELKPWECPIGISPDSRSICSAGTCYWCLRDLVQSLYTDGQLRLGPALDTVIEAVRARIADLEAQASRPYLPETIETWQTALGVLDDLRDAQSATHTPTGPAAQSDTGEIS